MSSRVALFFSSAGNGHGSRVFATGGRATGGASEAAAGELGLLGLPCFLFQEGRNPAVRLAFEQIAKLTGGACCAFDAGSAEQLKALLGAVAAYAAGGRAALLSYGERRGGAALQLTRQVR